MLIKSGFPLNDCMDDGISPLIMCARDKKANNIAMTLLYAGADPNLVTTKGQTALGEAICHDNKKLSELLVKKKCQIFLSQIEFRDQSPFF